SWDLSGVLRSSWCRIQTVAGGDILADFLEPVADTVEAGRLVLPEAAELPPVARFRGAELGMDDAQLFPFLGVLARLGLAEQPALARRAPLAEPERPVLGPALGLLGVVVRDEPMKVLEVTLQPLLDVGQLFGAALEVGVGRHAGDRDARRHG